VKCALLQMTIVCFPKIVCIIVHSYVTRANVVRMPTCTDCNVRSLNVCIIEVYTYSVAVYGMF